MIITGWSDGITKELNAFLESIGTLGDKSKEAIMEQVDIEAEIVRSELARNVPRRTGALARSLIKAKCTVRKNWYGYRIEFEGENEDGIPFQKIANILNYGTSHFKGTRFITKAIRKLRGMDDRIHERFEKMADEIVE